MTVTNVCIYHAAIADPGNEIFRKGADLIEYYRSESLPGSDSTRHIVHHIYSMSVCLVCISDLLHDLYHLATFYSSG